MIMSFLANSWQNLMSGKEKNVLDFGKFGKSGKFESFTVTVFIL